jgi:hypothetical protein
MPSRSPHWQTIQHLENDLAALARALAELDAVETWLQQHASTPGAGQQARNVQVAAGQLRRLRQQRIEQIAVATAKARRLSP